MEPSTRWSSRTPRRRCGRRARTRPPRPTRSSAPCSGSTTMPSSRRSSPQTCSTSSASWRPSTQIRLALACCARAGATGGDRAAVRHARRAPGAAGRTRVTGLPSTRNPAGLSVNSRRLPWRSRSVTASAVQATTSPQNPEAPVLDHEPRSPRPTAPAAPAAAARTRPGCLARTPWRRPVWPSSPPPAVPACRGDAAGQRDGAAEPLARRREHLVDAAGRRCAGTGRAATCRRPASRRRRARTGTPQTCTRRAGPTRARTPSVSSMRGVDLADLRVAPRRSVGAAVACHSTSNVTGTSVPCARRHASSGSSSSTPWASLPTLHCWNGTSQTWSAHISAGLISRPGAAVGAVELLDVAGTARPGAPARPSSRSAARAASKPTNSPPAPPASAPQNHHASTATSAWRPFVGRRTTASCRGRAVRWWQRPRRPGRLGSGVPLPQPRVARRALRRGRPQRPAARAGRRAPDRRHPGRLRRPGGRRRLPPPAGRGRGPLRRRRGVPGGRPHGAGLGDRRRRGHPPARARRRRSSRAASASPATSRS